MGILHAGEAVQGHSCSSWDAAEMELEMWYSPCISPG